MGYNYFVEPLIKKTNDLLASTMEKTSFYRSFYKNRILSQSLAMHCLPYFLPEGKPKNNPSIGFQVFGRKDREKIRGFTFLYS